MPLSEIQAELLRLQLHPVNLEALHLDGDKVVLKGSLLAFRPVPKVVDAAWFLNLLKGLPNNAGPKPTMDAFTDAIVGQRPSG
jgi:hypothetical protein